MNARCCSDRLDDQCMSQESNFTFRPEDFDYTPSDSLKYPNSKRLKRQRFSPNSSSSSSSITPKRQRPKFDSPGDSSFSTPNSTPKMALDLSSSSSSQNPVESLPRILPPEEFAKLDDKGKYDAYMTMATSFLTEMRQMRAEFKAEIAELKETVQQLKNQTTTDLQFEIMMAMNSMKDEPKKQEEKQKNLVIYGLPEDAQDPKAQQEADKELVAEILQKSGCGGSYDDTVASHFRMGAAGKILVKNGQNIQCPRLLKLKLKSEETRDFLLKKQKEFLPSVPAMQGKNYSQYIREDLTEFQRRLYGKMVDERNKRNAKLKPGDPKWTIFNGELRPPRKIQNNRIDLN